MTPKGLVALVAAFIVILLVSATVYVIPETHRGVLLRFGELVETDIQPGLHFKLPWIDESRTFDTRVLLLDVTTNRYLTIEKKPLDVDSYVTWQIQDVDQFYRSTGGDEMRAVSLITSRVDTGLRNEFAGRTMYEVISGERDALVDNLTESVDKLVEEEFGVKVRDIRVRAIELPGEVSQNVFRRMSTEREKEAQEYRSRGRELAEGIRADADRQRTIVLAEAFREAEEVRASGDRVAAKTYADAYDQNPEFFKLFRSLRAYEETFKDKGDMLVLDANSDFLRFMNDMQATGSASGNN
ncbi:protease modulator HflC [Hydrocarboniclastica marina]|mgnify:CR=1 FL=1|uniref:Protein HflC n=1 Tax=Hydrocarboniclastica marina TaxID=2259620 RepID=A0A4P7XHW0_9ALTE|nr:protease modulator HflC [Hydrocarboniclastica marina]MAL97517.1 HflC protein [Alteromonadaceae bacterium]QCF26616.1 protease modulator HflC [Hydrocarboniclastica marina]